MRQWSVVIGGGPTVPIFPIGPYFGVRTAQASSTIAAIRQIVQQQEPGATRQRCDVEQIVSNAMTVPRMYAILIGIFARVAMTLAAGGIYGVVAYAVTQRTREIGIRMALGARRGQVVTLVLAQSLALIAIGPIVGLGGAAAGTRYLEGLLFGLAPLDPSTFVYVAAAFAVVALLASYVPARRATRVDPLVAPRFE